MWKVGFCTKGNLSDEAVNGHMGLGLFGVGPPLFVWETTKNTEAILGVPLKQDTHIWHHREIYFLYVWLYLFVYSGHFGSTAYPLAV